LLYSKYVDVSYLDNLDNLGNTVKVYLDKNGEIFYAEEVDAEVEGYAVYVSKANGTLEEDDFGQGELSVDDTPRIKLFTAGGDVVVYDVYTGDIDLDASTTGQAVVDVKLGDIGLEIDALTGSGIISITGIDSTDKKSIVEYELNSDGELTELTFPEPEDTTDYVSGNIDDDDMTIKSYDIKSNTIVFNVEGDDEEDWEVVNSEYAVDATSGDLVFDEFDIVAMTAVGGLGDSDTYGIVTNVTNYYDGSDTVQRVTALVNGEEVTYITTDEDSVDDSDDVDKVVSFTFDGDRLDYVSDDVTVVTGGAIEVTQVDANRIRVEVEGEGLFDFADDAAVYVVEYTDSTKTEVDSWTAEDVSYLRDGDFVTLYLNSDDDVIVVVFDIDQDQYTD
jgi:hypothetical protein